MYQIIDGKEISTQIKNECRERVAAYKEEGIEICLAVIQVGNDLLFNLHLVPPNEYS